MKEVIYTNALNPSLNRDGGRYNLPPVWDSIIKKKADRPKRGFGERGAEARPPSRTASQTTLPSLMKLTDVGESSCALNFIILSIKCTGNCVSLQHVIWIIH